MTRKPHRGHDDPWASEPQPDVPGRYTAPITAALIMCQHCQRPIGLTKAPADAPAVTCTSCMRHAVNHLLGFGEPPF